MQMSKKNVAYLPKRKEGTKQTWRIHTLLYAALYCILRFDSLEARFNMKTVLNFYNLIKGVLVCGVAHSVFPKYLNKDNESEKKINFTALIKWESGIR
jgi:hypothetical protein